jgi:basic membrane protein A
MTASTRNVKRAVLALAVALLIATVAVATSTAARAGARVGNYSVAVLFPGTTNDLGWGQGFTDGARQASKKYGVKIALAENLNTPAQYTQQGAAYGSKNYNMILLAAGFVNDVADKLAKQFPNTTICAIRAPRPPNPPKNGCYYDPLQQEEAFLAGAAAGLATKSNVIGAVSGFEFPQLTRQPEAFALGARCVNPKVTFVQQYINSWTDAALAKAATESMMAKGADVFIGPLTTAIQGVYAAAREKKGVWVVPEYFDAYKQAPDVILTSVLYDLEGVTADLIARGSKGQLTPGQYIPYALKQLPTAGIAPFRGAAVAAIGSAGMTKLKQLRAEIISGKLRVPVTAVIGVKGAGTKINPKSIGC